MRFLPALGLAALLAAPAVSAQTTFGVKAGVQAATLTGDFFDDFDEVPGLDKRARLGFVGGLTADVPLSPSVAFRPELLYTQKGYALTYEDGSFLGFGGDDEVTITAKADYLELPLLIAYNVVQPSGLAFSVEAGPTLSYKLSTGASCSADGDLGDAFCDDFDEDDGDEEDGVEDFDLGGAIGATVGSGPFNVGIRYTQGFTNVVDNDLPDGFEGDEPTARNSTFAATLIYKFGAR